MIQTEDSYNRDVFNGDLEVIEKLNRIERMMSGNSAGRSVEYDFGDLDELALAYVLSIHKSQGGSESLKWSVLKRGWKEQASRMKRRKKTKTLAKRKMSEMISEMAEGFLWVGDTIDEWQNRLNAACSAWNMACGSPEVRQRQLDQYGQGYLRYNPATSPNDLANIVKDMETLIERKLNMFPNDHRQIVSARVLKVGTKYRIEVASATLH